MPDRQRLNQTRPGSSFPVLAPGPIIGGMLTTRSKTKVPVVLLLGALAAGGLYIGCTQDFDQFQQNGFGGSTASGSEASSASGSGQSVASSSAASGNSSSGAGMGGASASSSAQSSSAQSSSSGSPASS